MSEDETAEWPHCYHIGITHLVCIVIGARPLVPIGERPEIHPLRAQNYTYLYGRIQ